MALLMKGILGTPKGKIGKLMGYQKNGRGFIQQVPTVYNAYLRYWNLLEPLIANQLFHTWNSLNASRQSQWASTAPPGNSGFDYYKSYFLERVFKTESHYLNGMALAPTFINSYQDALVEGNWYDYSLRFFIHPSDPFWLISGTPQLVVYIYNLAGILIGADYIPISSSQGYFLAYITNSQKSNAASLVLVLRHVTPLTITWNGSAIVRGMRLITYNN